MPNRVVLFCSRSNANIGDLPKKTEKSGLCLALAGFKAWVYLVDNVNAATTAHQTVSPVTAFKRFQRVSNLHNINHLSVCRRRVSPQNYPVKQSAPIGRAEVSCVILEFIAKCQAAPAFPDAKITGQRKNIAKSSTRLFSQCTNSANQLSKDNS